MNKQIAIIVMINNINWTALNEYKLNRTIIYTIIYFIYNAYNPTNERTNKQEHK